MVDMPECFISWIGVLRMHLFGHWFFHCSETVLNSQFAPFLSFLFRASFKLVSAILFLIDIAPEWHHNAGVRVKLRVDFSLSFGLHLHYVLQFEIVLAFADLLDINVLSQLKLIIHVPALLISNKLRYPLIEGQLALGVFLVAMNWRDSRYHFFQERKYLILVKVLQF